MKRAYCDNCGHPYWVWQGYRFIKAFRESPTIHGVCEICFMPMNLNNPFYKENH